ncbi:hypothetical protein AB0D46_27780 [Streptomyces sp. NPDC048383]|uniref:hypothetical protein n=1 Tax=Streptomyces sp. NPDC048383 TaxID=3155386 RepID=UPI003428A455
MSMRRKVKAREGAAGMVSAALLFTLAGCGEGDDGQPNPPAASSTPKPGASGSGKGPSPSASQPSAPEQVVATLKGEAGMVLDINSAVRDAGGFVTISGQIKNTGDKPFGNTAAWRGNELKASGVSVAGVNLVDKAGKKRYYVLRDTEGRCLCTTGVVIIDPAQSIPFFAQFPAPPATTTEVDFNFPTFASTTLKISG